MSSEDHKGNGKKRPKREQPQFNSPSEILLESASPTSGLDASHFPQMSTAMAANPQWKRQLTGAHFVDMPIPPLAPYALPQQQSTWPPVSSDLSSAGPLLPAASGAPTRTGGLSAFTPRGHNMNLAANLHELLLSGGISMAMAAQVLASATSSGGAVAASAVARAPSGLPVAMPAGPQRLPPANASGAGTPAATQNGSGGSYPPQQRQFQHHQYPLMVNAPSRPSATRAGAGGSGMLVPAGLHHAAAAAAYRAHAAASSSSLPGPSKDQKQAEKRDANKRSAQLCRQRKKHAVQALHDQNQELRRHREVLSTLSDMVFSFDVRDAAGVACALFVKSQAGARRRSSSAVSRVGGPPPPPPSSRLVAGSEEGSLPLEIFSAFSARNESEEGTGAKRTNRGRSHSFATASSSSSSSLTSSMMGGGGVVSVSGAESSCDGAQGFGARVHGSRAGAVAVSVSSSSSASRHESGSASGSCLGSCYGHGFGGGSTGSRSTGDDSCFGDSRSCGKKRPPSLSSTSTESSEPPSSFAPPESKKLKAERTGGSKLEQDCPFEPVECGIGYVSAAVQKTLQYEEDELLGHNFFDILSFDSREQLGALLCSKLAEYGPEVALRREEAKVKRQQHGNGCGGGGMATNGGGGGSSSATPGVVPGAVGVESSEGERGLGCRGSGTESTGSGRSTTSGDDSGSSISSGAMQQHVSNASSVTNLSTVALQPPSLSSAAPPSQAAAIEDNRLNSVESSDDAANGNGRGLLGGFATQNNAGSSDGVSTFGGGSEKSSFEGSSDSGQPRRSHTADSAAGSRSSRVASNSSAMLAAESESGGGSSGCSSRLESCEGSSDPSSATSGSGSGGGGSDGGESGVGSGGSNQGGSPGGGSSEPIVIDLCNHQRVQMMRRDGTVVTGMVNGVLSISVEGLIEVVASVRPFREAHTIALGGDDCSSEASSLHNLGEGLGPSSSGRVAREDSQGKAAVRSASAGGDVEGAALVTSGRGDVGSAGGGGVRHHRHHHHWSDANAGSNGGGVFAGGGVVGTADGVVVAFCTGLGGVLEPSISSLIDSTVEAAPVLFVSAPFSSSTSASASTSGGGGGEAAPMQLRDVNDSTSDGDASKSDSEPKQGGSSPETVGSEEAGHFGDVDSDNADEASSSGSEDNGKSGPLSGEVSS